VLTRRRRARPPAVVNTVTNKVARILGRDETVRFTNIALYQGLPIKKGVTTIAMATSENPLLATKDERDPTLFCTAWKRPRFYLFTRSEPECVLLSLSFFVSVSGKS